MVGTNEISSGGFQRDQTVPAESTATAPKLAVQRLVLGIAGDFVRDFRFEFGAMEAIQEAAESLVIKTFESESFAFLM